MAAEQSQLTVHNVVLDVEARSLTGPRGFVQLQPHLFAVGERLFRRPKALVSETHLISAIYPDPDCEPETAAVVLRVRICALRQVLNVLSGNRVRIRTDRGHGWALEVQL